MSIQHDYQEAWERQISYHNMACRLTDAEQWRNVNKKLEDKWKKKHESTQWRDKLERKQIKPGGRGSQVEADRHWLICHSDVAPHWFSVFISLSDSQIKHLHSFPQVPHRHLHLSLSLSGSVGDWCTPRDFPPIYANTTVSCLFHGSPAPLIERRVLIPENCH